MKKSLAVAVCTIAMMGCLYLSGVSASEKTVTSLTQGDIELLESIVGKIDSRLPVFIGGAKLVYVELRCPRNNEEYYALADDDFEFVDGVLRFRDVRTGGIVRSTCSAIVTDVQRKPGRK